MNILEKYNGFGYSKTPSGQRDILFVEKKLPEIELQSMGVNIAPKSFDVVEAKIVLYAEKVRPLVGGLSTGIVGKEGNPIGVVGTVGGFAYEKSTNKIVGITNRHVILDTMNLTLMQPALADITNGGGGKMSDFFIGNPLKRSENFDAVTVDIIVDVTPNEQYNIGTTVGEFADVKPGMIVKKQGRTTNQTTGKVELFTTIKHPSLAITFQNDMLIEGLGMRFSMEGDSGSFIYSEDNKLVGLLWGGLETTDGRFFTVAHKAEDVFKDLGLSLTESVIEEPDTEEPLVIDETTLVNSIVFYQGLNKEAPSRELSITITKLQEALFWVQHKNKQ